MFTISLTKTPPISIKKKIILEKTPIIIIAISTITATIAL